MNNLAKLAIAAAALLPNAACHSGGSYTETLAEAATERMNTLRAVTERGMAEEAFLSGKLDRAEERLREALTSDADHAPSHRLLARVLLESGRLRAAAASAARAIELAPADPAARYVAATIAERAGDDAAALRHFRAAAELDPEDAHAVLAAAELMVETGDPAGAEAYLEAWPGTAYDPGAAQTLGQLAMLRGDAEAAVERFRDARLLAPGDDQILEDLAAALFAAGRYGESEALLSILRSRPEFASRRDLRRQQAACLREIGETLRARDAFLALARETPDDAGAAPLWAAAGELSYRLGDAPRVREAASRLVGLAPERSEGYVLWGLWHWSRGDVAAARRSIASGLDHAADADDLELLRAALDRVETGPSAAGPHVTGVIEHD